MAAWYNENDLKAAAWIRELIKAGHVTPGDVDTRSIKEIEEVPDDERAHFFAGIAGWDYALRLAGWPADRSVWTGSCPCQPFSAAGKRQGESDPRHLWPDFLRLIAEHRPATVFGEQVASKAGREWLAGVRADLEALGYAVGAADLCAAGAGAPHIRQRLFWVADAGRPGDECRVRPSEASGAVAASEREAQQRQRSGPNVGSGGSDGRLADATSSRRIRPEQGPESETRDKTRMLLPGEHGSDGDGCGLEHAEGDGRQQRRAEPSGRGAANRRSESRLADADGRDTSAEGLQRSGEHGQQPQDGGDSFWNDAEIVICRDPKGPKARRIEPGTFPLAHGIPNRVGLLRGYGNAIVPQVAAEFVSAFMEAASIQA